MPTDNTNASKSAKAPGNDSADAGSTPAGYRQSRHSNKRVEYAPENAYRICLQREQTLVGRVFIAAILI
jgi:hypothetical protein